VLDSISAWIDPFTGHVAAKIVVSMRLAIIAVKRHFHVFPADTTTRYLGTAAAIFVICI
jgi:hypothetical protein